MSVRKCAVAAIVAVVAMGVMSPIASAQDAQCWEGAWARTGDPWARKFANSVDKTTGFPYPTVPAVTEYVESLLAFYPTMSSYSSERIMHCGY